ncbi:DUF5077 domain-containing protein [Pseudoalteromonas sp. K222D]|uniref:DUF5077 domain-containing protein n=1 Tax=Pseudoalteromonas sp. K222D TaxID=2820756 RepID=UPI001AD72271|nr:DUF5077 domain-containing protein [Pseudoalteromonas sp. K222D]MBO7926869.1 DUF5077 domain-containing protein [Pseudoalteromonas sp. K222D]
MKKIFFRTVLLISSIFILGACNDKQPESFKALQSHRAAEQSQYPAEPIVVPIGVNSWVIDDSLATSSIVAEKGGRNWQDLHHVISTYFHIDKPTNLKIAIQASAACAV